MGKRMIFLATVCAAALAGRAATQVVNGITWTYTVSGGKASVGGGSSSPAVPSSTKGAITIPSTLGGRPVTSIGECAFYNCSGLTSVTIPNSVTSIGDEAFCHCRGLTSVTILNSVTSIGELAFCDCSGLTSVRIPASVTSIGYQAFAYCRGLTSVTISEGVPSIGISAFFCCSALTSITIPASVTSIENYAFGHCSALADIAFCGDAPSVGEDDAFYGLAAGCTVTVKWGTAGWDDDGNGYWQMLPLKYVDLPDGGPYAETVGGVTWTFRVANGEASVGGGDYHGARAVPADTTGAIAIPSTLGGRPVTSVGDYAFCEFSALTGVTIPEGVTSIGRCAFYECSLKSVTIPEGVTSIGDSAFAVCVWLASVTIPNSVTSIGEGAFYNCLSLPSITIPSGVTSIDDDMFYACYGLKSVTMPKGVTSIGSCVFWGCRALASVTIPASVTSIGERAFYECSGLTNVVFEGAAPSVGQNAFEHVASGCAAAVACDKKDTFLEGEAETWIGLNVVLQHGEACVSTARREPTCTEPGWTQGSYCGRCHAVLETSQPLSALGHAEVVTTAAKAPTCTADGFTEGSKCSRCNIVLSKPETLPALGHSGAIAKPAVEPTSAKAGATAEIRCSRCNALLQAAEAIPALGYVRNVTARQLWPHKKVEVSYTLADDIGEVAEEKDEVRLTSSAGHTARNVIGDKHCTPGPHRVVWDMEADGVKVKADEMKFTVGF